MTDEVRHDFYQIGLEVIPELIQCGECGYVAKAPIDDEWEILTVRKSTRAQAPNDEPLRALVAMTLFDVLGYRAEGDYIKAADAVLALLPRSANDGTLREHFRREFDEERAQLVRERDDAFAERNVTRAELEALPRSVPSREEIAESLYLRDTKFPNTVWGSLTKEQLDTYLVQADAVLALLARAAKP